MGPRPNGRGKRIGRTCPSTSRYGFNGAAAKRPRKAVGYGPDLLSAHGFNGAAAKWPRKASLPAAGCR